MSFGRLRYSVLLVFLFYAALSLGKKKCPFCFWEWNELLFWSCLFLLQKTCFHFSYSGVNLVHNPVISAASAGSAAFLPACPVLRSVVPTPAPASLLCTAILCGITPSLLCSLHRLISGACWPLLGCLSAVWYQGSGWLSITVTHHLSARDRNISSSAGIYAIKAISIYLYI